MADPSYWGLKYSKPIHPVLGVTDPRKLGFSSYWNCLKTYATGRRSVTCASNVITTLTINHGLGYRPAFNAYFRDTLNGEVYQVMSGFENTIFNRVNAEINAHAASDNSTLTFSIYNNNAASRNVDVFFEIFIEDLVST